MSLPNPSFRTRLGLPLFCTGISAVTTSLLDGGGQINRRVTLDGVTFRRGDLMIGDDDGLFILSPDRARNLLNSAREKQDRDAPRREELSARLASPRIAINLH